MCSTCIKKLQPLFYQRCLYCKKPSIHGFTHPPCRKKEGVDGVVSLFLYNDILKKFIKGLKYSLATAAYGDLLFLVGAFGKEELLFYQTKKHLYLQPIPLSPEKQKTRGFNQAALVSKIIAHLVPLSQVDALERSTNSPPQAQTASSGKRKENVKGAFRIKKGGNPPNEIILIDDVVTTGATVWEAAKTLKKGGAQKVYVFSVAKG